MPTVAFGIPGSAAMAILLGAFLIQGLTPGPEMLTTKLSITFSMMWTMIFANIIGALLLMAWANQLQKIIFVPANLILPGITFFVLIGAWTAGNNIGDWITLLVFGVIGLVMKRAGWPRAPLILGFILGRIMENSLHISMPAYGMSLILRPICLAILARDRHHHLLCGALAPAPQARYHDGRGLGRRSGRTEALARSRLAICLVLIYAIAAAFSWPPTVRLFPLAFSIPALLLAAFAVYFDWRAVQLGRGRAQRPPPGSSRSLGGCPHSSTSSPGSPASWWRRSCSASTSPCPALSRSICWSGAAIAGRSRWLCGGWSWHHDRAIRLPIADAVVSGAAAAVVVNG